MFITLEKPQIVVKLSTVFFESNMTCRYLQILLFDVAYFKVKIIQDHHH